MEESEEQSGLETVTDAIGDLVSGVPAPIRKNFFKAFAQLCTAAIDIPVAKMEGVAKEIRAASSARVQIIEKQGEQIAEQLDIPKEYVIKASEKFASKVVKEQLNLDQITLNAANNLKQEDSENEQQASKEEISDDWLNEFENYAKLKSSEEMKLVFGKILSGEITKPGTFSIRTVRLISQLDNQAAKLFQLLCSQSVSMYIGKSHMLDARVVSFSGSPASNSLTKYGLSFDNLNVLQEYGLIISDYNSYMNYAPCVANDGIHLAATLYFGETHYGLIPTDKEKYDKTVRLNGVTFTKAGKELRKIIPLKDASNYKKDLDEFFNKKHLKLTKI
ncbi:DUF2806 domain-containing protein [Winogradskyella sediminis]|uniref:DUF2806 domain-containing protein n=1 Tax=Winogradskyella sediminis TaxID=1382466 RepID=UPI000E243EC3|nr:DUF2806 domain-containing protein [Winogradskyella sediminis]REG84084.1 uncharacterized protein DUF2806 [Winogradskyella sediminis]